MKKTLNLSERVKECDLHPTKPWVLSSLFDGKLQLLNYKTGNVVKVFELSELPIRTAKFVIRERWIVCGGDEMSIMVVNYDTGVKAHTFEAHQDYIRCLDVHPSKSYVISCADDLVIKMWDWENKWAMVRQFEAHTHFIMEVTFNPKDPNQFASASLDSTVRMWNIKSTTPSFSLEGHSKGVNSVAFYHGKDKPFLVTGSDDKNVKVWDYQTKACVQTLEGHSDNVTVVCFHPRLGYILSGSEDNSVNIWNNQTYELEERLTYGLGRVWSIKGHLKATTVGFGFDNGTLVLSLGKEVPLVSMDKRGKIICTNKTEVRQMMVKSRDQAELADGEKISVPHKELGITEINPSLVLHDDKGRYVVVAGNGEYVIYKAISWTNQSFGQAEEFVWGKKTGQYATLMRSGKVKVFSNFKEVKTIDCMFTVEGIFGGELIAVKSKEFVFFYDWDTCTLLLNIEICPSKLFWTENGRSVVLATNDKMYFLAFDKRKVAKALGEGAIGEDGVEDCIETEFILDEKVKQGMWIGDCFLYINSDKALKYYLSGNITTVALLDMTYYLLGFVGKFNRIFLMDKEYNLVSYTLHISVLQYQAYIIDGDIQAAEKIFSAVPKEAYNKLAQFLHKNSRGRKKFLQKALKISSDEEHRFTLSLELDDIPECIRIAEKTQSEEKWRQIGSLCLNRCQYRLAEKCFLNGGDFPGLLLLYSTFEDKEGMGNLAKMARERGKNNIAFVSNMLLGKINECIQILIDAGRLPEATFMARTYLPSRISEVLNLWKDRLGEKNEKLAKSLADPIEFKNMFPGFEEAVEMEKARDVIGEVKEEEKEADEVEVNPEEEEPKPAEVEEPKPAEEEQKPEEEEGKTEEVEKVEENIDQLIDQIQEKEG